MMRSVINSKRTSRGFLLRLECGHTVDAIHDDSEVDCLECERIARQQDPFDTPAGAIKPRPGDDSDDPPEALINAVALANAFFGDRRYVRFYEKLPAELREAEQKKLQYSVHFAGFLGCWRFIAQVAQLFSHKEETEETEWDGRFISAVDHVVEAIYAATLEEGKPPTLELIQQAVDIGFINALND